MPRRDAVTRWARGRPPGPAPDPARVAGPEAASATDVGVAGSRVAVDVQVAVDHGVPLQAVAETVRQPGARRPGVAGRPQDAACRRDGMGTTRP
jgi:hypothetical protein